MISYIEVRALAINENLVEALLALVAAMTTEFYSERLFTLKINRTLTWLISNFCRKPNPPPYSLTFHFIPYLATMLHFNDD